MAPHATGGIERRRSSSSHARPTTFKFPELSSSEQLGTYDEDATDGISRDPSPRPLGLPNGLHSAERWPARKESRSNWKSWSNGVVNGGIHGRQKSLSEAIRTVRTRKMSVSQNAHEIADALKAPVSPTIIVLCGVWYAASILSNTSSKAILTALPKPVTLTVMQFLFVCGWCLVSAWVAKHSPAVRNAVPVLRFGIRKPTRELIITTLPLTAFQIGGHILNSDAMSRVPVSLVHTIKGLSPLLTVMAYRTFFNRRYSSGTYLSLVPLTLGVIMACSASFKGNILGLTYAFGSALLFVSQNIVSKKLFDQSAQAEADGVPQRNRKPDKLNLLCYSSGLALLLTLPLWMWSEGLPLLADFLQDASVELSERPGSLDHARLALEFIFNGTFHFGQSLVAFVLLGMVSPVTYSVASLIKRVFVILFAIVWFGNPMTTIQGFGFALTFAGLYLYDRMSDAEKADKRAKVMDESKDTLLPLVNADAKRSDAPVFVASPISDNFNRPLGGGSGYSNGDPVGSGPGRPRAPSGLSPHGGTGWLPPGTKQEETWNRTDVVRQQAAPVR